MAANNDRHEQQMALDDESTSPAHYVRAAADGHNQLIDVCSPQQPIRAPKIEWLAEIKSDPIGSFGRIAVKKNVACRG